MKFLPLVLGLALAGCLRAPISTSSRILSDFSPRSGGGTVTVLMEGDLSRFVNSDPVIEETKQYTEEALRDKGWVTTRNLKDANYGLMLVERYRGSEVTGITMNDGWASVDRLHAHSLAARLVRVTSSGGPGSTVWEGSAGLGTYNRTRDAVRPDMAYKLIQVEFPRRDQ